MKVKPLVKFVMLSKDLAAGFVRDHEEFMDGRELPIQLVAQPVDELMMHLTNISRGTTSPHFVSRTFAESYILSGKKHICLFALFEYSMTNFFRRCTGIPLVQKSLLSMNSFCS